MHTQLLRRAPDIARHFVGIWNDHEQALATIALPYLHHLMEAELEAGAMTPMELAVKLRRMVPHLQWGTAHRLVDLAYPASN
jgi:hypothetical protein